MKVSNSIKQAYDLFKQDPSERCRVAVRHYRADQISSLIRTSPGISTEEFNKNIWVFESKSILSGEDITGRIFESGKAQDHKHLDSEFISTISDGITSKDLEIHGNVTWGTGTTVFAPKIQDDPDKQKLINEALSILRDENLKPIEKANNLMTIDHFGENIATGLVMHMYPYDFSIWNRRSKAAIWMLGGYAENIETFQMSIKELKQAVAAASFLELDWFLYLLGEGKLEVPGLSLELGRKVANVRAMHSTHKRMTERRKSEADARKLVEAKLDSLDQSDVAEMLRLLNVDWHRGKEVNTRFQLAFTGSNKKMMVEDWQSVRDVIVELWNVKDEDVYNFIDEIKGREKPKGAGVTLYSALMYLKNAEKYNIWLPYVARNLQAFNLPGLTASWDKSYDSYNQSAIKLRDIFNIQPEEVDLVLWGLANEAEGIAPEDLFINILQRYHNENIVFQSAVHGQHYLIQSVDENGCITERLDADEPQRVTASGFRTAYKAIQAEGGNKPFTALSSTAAIRNTYLQSPLLALKSDKLTVIDVADDENALNNFIDIIENLRVATVKGEPAIYKPAMLACLIEGIESGELTENKITFDWIVPKYVEKVGTLGRLVDSNNASSPFYHLTSDLIWNLAYENPYDRLKNGTDGPAATRRKVKYAYLKETYWKLLQKQSNRIRCLNALKQTWWPEDDYMNLDKYKELFVSLYDGFETFKNPGQQYLDEERNYKVALRDWLHELLDGWIDSTVDSIKSEDFELKIKTLLRKRIPNFDSGQNFLNWRDVGFVENNLLNNKDNIIEFMEVLHPLLRSVNFEGDLNEQLQIFLDYLASKKTPPNLTKIIPTFFMFFWNTERSLFLKPQICDRFLRTIGVKPLGTGKALTVSEHERLVGIAHGVRHAINDLMPEDLIDVQSFMFIVQTVLDGGGEVGNEERNIWWVNQGRSLTQAVKTDCIWAPLESIDGKKLYHWETLSEVNEGDVILHYSDNHLRFVSRVVNRAVAADRPYELADEPWNKEGRLVKVEYHPLEPNIPLPDFVKAISNLDIHEGPIDRTDRVKQGYLFRFDEEALARIQALTPYVSWPEFAIVKLDEEPILDLNQVCDDFSAALLDSHISFGSNHSEIIRSFVASLATKGLAILTGLSGSGKTQIAIRFGEWLGKERLKVIPVRPDWTGPEPLFGYPDALQPCSKDGRSAWHVPEALEFMLEAVQHPEEPYLLVLDEMNLAHVERYFADFLSGMESEYECLPNLRKIEDDGQWRLIQGQKEKLPLPKNLFVVGTVNVDETTYMFSPKVLDRGNTFEFRVKTDDLNTESKKPTQCNPGDLALVKGFLRIAIDDQWQESNPASNLDEFTGNMMTIHSLLAQEGFEFGHRTFYEAIRFAAMLSSSGDDNAIKALDLQIMQKILPKLHGSRRKLEGLLCSVGKFCHNLEADGDGGIGNRFDPEAHSSDDAVLPISFDKVKRMTRSLRANQFTSFTE